MTSEIATDPQPLWTPGEEFAGSDLDRFATFVAERTGQPMPDFWALWRWSTADAAGFWAAVWEFYDVGASTAYDSVVSGGEMPGARWFAGARGNYADQVLRWRDQAGEAIVAVTEDGARRVLSWPELARDVAGFAGFLRRAGVRPGDRVVGYVGNVPEAVVAFLGAASVGATWAACGLDYAVGAAVDRLGQLGPRVLVAATATRFNGRHHDRRDAVRELVDAFPEVDTLVLIGDESVEGIREGVSVAGWADAIRESPGEATEQVPAEHPLWVLFSSGTTGLPKGIVHGHLGVVLEHLVAIGLHSGIGPGSRFFWYTSTNWMMWNYLVGGLLTGATVILYDGSPTQPGPDRMWELCAAERVTHFGTSPAYLQACIKAGLVPGREHDLATLLMIGVTGAPLPASSAEWIMANVGARVQINSISGGTDVVSAFLGAAPNLPVYAGELSGPFLGTALDAFDPQGRPVRGEVGELVITAPIPSMPVCFWNDPDGVRYHDAYFDTYPGVWRHGDWITITDRGSAIIHGRSDSTLNRHGIRMGTADLYEAIESLPEVREALVIGCELPGGDYWMPLFVAAADGVEVDDGLWARIKDEVRTRVSPRHVPDEVYAVPAVPHTRTGKKLEVPIKRILLGAPLEKVVKPEAVDDPGLLDFYVGLAARRAAAAGGR
ncbi:MAG: acetoacetate--CoA ligase [Dermatophilaceae bacterium]